MTFKATSQPIDVAEVRQLAKLEGDMLARKESVTESWKPFCVAKMTAFSWLSVPALQITKKRC